jgi:hypothetical protein
MYRETPLIFCARAGVHPRALGNPLSGEWIDWMG